MRSNWKSPGNTMGQANQVNDLENNQVTHAEPKSAPTNVLIVGVGGQGVIMVSKVLAQLCQEQGYQVKQSEVHGMAKRGGSVFSHVRFGEQVHSPTIQRGKADILVALEWAEGLRWLPFLNPEHGIFIADTQQIVPPFACRDRRRGASRGYARESVKQVIEQVPNSFALDAVGMATQLGVAKAANTILLGTLSTALGFSADAWKSVISRFVPPKTIEANLQAFDAGHDWTENFDKQTALKDLPGEDSNFTPVRQVVADSSVVEIKAEWCKSCDICVKFCPEHCLRLDSQLIAELFNAEACTGCRLCEWLCPDFAITVHTPVAVTTP